MIARIEAVFSPLLAEHLDKIAAIEMQFAVPIWNGQQLMAAYQAAYPSCICEVEKTLVGYAFWMRAAEVVDLLHLAIHPDWQRQGYGRSLLRYVLHQMHLHGGQRVFLEVRESNRRAQELYCAHGFCVTGRRKNYYPCGSDFEDAILMSANL
jgi:ribosomal-protein-alanine N-acetyltransferase